ncbi:hypothetical protein EDC04DRAFT_2866372 [Pisolithus marmoratus]|nr:hypothetical protein EDC04DRAFT_2866372 [Pisolithus marmoratus]
MWTSSWWEKMQAKLPEGSCITPVIIAMDKTQLTQFSGGQQAYPAAHSARMHRVFHKSMRLLLEPLVKAGSEGIEIVGGDGHVCKVHPILACYITDYLEQCLVTCCKFRTCPKCPQKQSALGDQEPGELREQCRCCLISGTIVTPFWVRFPLCCIHTCVMADVHQQLFQGIIKYLITWCLELINKSELDC